MFKSEPPIDKRKLFSFTVTEGFKKVVRVGRASEVAERDSDAAGRELGEPQI